MWYNFFFQHSCSATASKDKTQVWVLTITKGKNQQKVEKAKKAKLGREDFI